MVGKFSDIVNDWCKATPQRVEEVYQTALGLLADELGTTESNGGKVPHLTGNLIQSLLASSSPIAMGSGGDKYAGSDPGAVIAQSDTSTPIFFGYQANYAHRLNYGFIGQDSLGRNVNQAGRRFVEYAVSMWPVMVKLANESVETTEKSR